jgi:hypothetical protein
MVDCRPRIVVPRFQVYRRTNRSRYLPGDRSLQGFGVSMRFGQGQSIWEFEVKFDAGFASDEVNIEVVNPEAEPVGY